MPVIGMSYRSEVQVTIYKMVRCEVCATEFAYQMTRAAEGTAEAFLFLDMKGAEQQAQDRATDAARKKLEDDSDLVPCPGCGHYQEHMIRDARRRRLPGMKVLGLVSLFLAFCAALVAWLLAQLMTVLVIATGLAVTAGGFSFLMLYCRHVFNRRFDPNRYNVEARIAKGRARTIRKEEFLRLQSQHEQ